MKARKVGPPSIWDKPFWPDPATVPYNVEGSYAKVKPMETNYTAAGSSKETPVVAAVELSSWERMQRFTWNSFEDSESSVFVSHTPQPFFSSRSATRPLAPKVVEADLSLSIGDGRVSS